MRIPAALRTAPADTCRRRGLGRDRMRSRAADPGGSGRLTPKVPCHGH